jgi:hypothetical protein
VIGLLILIYDHTATFRAERRLMWTSPASLAKFGFYINRYLVPMCIFTIFIPLSGYVGLDVSNLVSALFICSFGHSLNAHASTSGVPGNVGFGFPSHDVFDYFGQRTGGDAGHHTLGTPTGTSSRIDCT